jgi:hypothetical protein
MFTQSTYDLTVLENMPRGFMFGRVLAVDKDISEMYSTVTYEMDRSTQISAFRLDKTTGAMYVDGFLDTEKVQPKWIYCGVEL